MDQTELRDRLEAFAEREAPPLRKPEELVAAVVSRNALRRQRWAVAAAVAALLLAVPAARSWIEPDPGPAAPESSSYDVYGPPTRGSLADDTGVVDAVGRLPWAFDGTAENPAPPVEDRHVVWVSDVSGRRWALVAGPDPTAVQGRPGRTGGTVAVAWFEGRADDGIAGMRLRSVRYGVDPALPSAFHDPESRAVVVVADPTDDIQISRRPQIHAGGDVTRLYEAAPAREGVAVVDSDTSAPVDLALRYRVARAGFWVTGRPDSDGVLDAGPADIPLERLRPPPPASPGDGAAAVEIGDVLARTGLSVDQVTVTVVWAGDVPRPEYSPARVTLLAVELPSGASYVTSAIGYDTEGRASRSTSCGSEIRPAGAAVDRQVFVLRCYVGGGARDTADPALVVVAPPASSAAEAWDAADGFLGGYPLTDGVAVVPVPPGLDPVDVLDADGHPLARRAPMGTADVGG
jgi:hypothetical protein